MAQLPATVILPSHTPELFVAAVEQAAAALRTGQAVAIPTETVYGLAVNALDPNAVALLFAIKGRPAHNPVIVHIHQLEMACRCVAEWSDTAEALARAFWPGPLTLVLPKAPGIPDAITAGSPTVALRWPAHALFQAVIQACGFPLAAPSANLSGSTSPTRAKHVLRSLGGRIPLILDGGACQVGIESTVLDLTQGLPRILRPGILDETALASVVGRVQPPADAPAAARPSSPGLLDRHYAPCTPLRILSWTDDAHLEAQLVRLLAPHQDARPITPTPSSPLPVCVLARDRIPTRPRVYRLRVMPHEPRAYARVLYHELHLCDQTGARFIIVEAVPPTTPWRAVADRLRRAAH
jgi:L-threonylcarbamoyladenylate synthase